MSGEIEAVGAAATAFPRSGGARPCDRVLPDSVSAARVLHWALGESATQHGMSGRCRTRPCTKGEQRNVAVRISLIVADPVLTVTGHGRRIALPRLIPGSRTGMESVRRNLETAISIGVSAVRMKPAMPEYRNDRHFIGFHRGCV